LFDNPKPVDLLKRFKLFYKQKNSIILDFFSELQRRYTRQQLNDEDGGTRQLSCAIRRVRRGTGSGTGAIKTLRNRKERIRRAAKKIKEKLTTKDTKNTKIKKKGHKFFPFSAKPKTFLYSGVRG
jgi:adenine-specific DNA-methyltransferase